MWSTVWWGWNIEWVSVVSFSRVSLISLGDFSLELIHDLFGLNFWTSLQGITIKPLVKLIKVRTASDKKPTMNEVIHTAVRMGFMWIFHCCCWQWVVLLLWCCRDDSLCLACPWFTASKIGKVWSSIWALTQTAAGCSYSIRERWNPIYIYIYPLKTLHELLTFLFALTFGFLSPLHISFHRYGLGEREQLSSRVLCYSRIVNVETLSGTFLYQTLWH